MNTHTSNLANRKYLLSTIEKTEAPEDMPEDGNWYRYVVMYGTSEINCVKSGTLGEVTQHANDFVTNLNARSNTNYSYASRNIKTKTV